LSWLALIQIHISTDMTFDILWSRNNAAMTFCYYQETVNNAFKASSQVNVKHAKLWQTDLRIDTETWNWSSCNILQFRQTTTHRYIYIVLGNCPKITLKQKQVPNIARTNTYSLFIVLRSAHITCVSKRHTILSEFRNNTQTSCSSIIIMLQT